MKIENETDDDIDYNQTGGGGADVGRAADPCEGQLPRQAQTPQFPPCGAPPWTVTFTDPAGHRCTVSGLTRPGVNLTVRSLFPDCEIDQS